VEEVEEDQRADGHRRLAVQVDPAREVDDGRLRRSPGLDARLHEVTHRLLEVDDVPRVLERDRRPVGVVHPASHEAVGVISGGEQQHLPEDIEDAVGQEPRLERAGASQHRFNSS